MHTINTRIRIIGRPVQQVCYIKRQPTRQMEFGITSFYHRGATQGHSSSSSFSPLPGSAMVPIIKQSPDEFVVVEIDPRGMRVDDKDYLHIDGEVDSDTTNTPCTLLNDGSEITPAAVEDDSEAYFLVRDPSSLQPLPDQASTPVTLSSPPAFSPTDPIERFLDPLVLGKLSLLARAVDGEMDACHGRMDSVQLGCVSDKHRRGMMRCAVRYHFPQLTTIVGTQQENGALTATKDECYVTLRQCLGAENAQQCIRLSVASRRDDPPALLAPFLASATKEDRRAFHEAIAKACSNLHCRVAHGNVQITVKRQNNNSNRWKRPRDEEPGSDALRSTTYTHCVVEKRNVDSFQMQSLLAEAISSTLQRDQRVTAGAISIAGTKDKKAVTFQRVSFRGEVSDADIARLLDQRFFAGRCTDSWVAIRSIKSGLKAPIQLGALSGNHFTITVHTPAGMESIFPPRNFRFLNYFGPQRFGRCAALSDHVGVHLIGGRYCEAVEGLLRHLPSSLYDEIVQGGSVGLEVVRRKVNANAHRDCAVILEAVVSLSRRRGQRIRSEDVIQRSELWAAVCKDSITAHVPFALRQLWLHAAQSLVFNLTVSMLAETHPIDALPEVLPLLGKRSAEGYKQTDVVNQTIETILASLGLTRAMFEVPSVVGVPLRGSERAVLERPTNVTWSRAAVPEGMVGGQVVVGFDLKSSCYATVALREIFGVFCAAADGSSTTGGD